jgi:hypothetical protein
MRLGPLAFGRVEAGFEASSGSPGFALSQMNSRALKKAICPPQTMAKSFMLFNEVFIKLVPLALAPPRSAFCLKSFAAAAGLQYRVAG